MGTVSINTFEGQTDGNPATVSNSAASGLPYTSSNFPTNTSATYKAAAAIRGSMGLEIARVAATSCYFVRTLVAQNRYSKLIGLRFPTVPTDYVILHAFRNAANQQSAALAIDATDHPYICVGGAGTPATAVSGSTLTATVQSGIGRYLGYDVDAVAGTWWIGLFDATGALLEEKSGTGASFGAAQITNDRIGILGGGSNVAILWHLDDDQQEDVPSTHPTVPGAAPSLVARPTSIVSNAGSSWTPVGGAASMQAALADELDSTFIRSADSPTGQEIIMAIGPLADGPITIPVRHAASAITPPISRVYKVYQGATAIATRTVNPLPVDWTIYEIDLTTGEEAFVTDRNNLRLGVADQEV